MEYLYDGVPASAFCIAPNKSSKLQTYTQCVTQTLTPAWKNDFTQWAGQLKSALKFGVAAGVGTAAVITFSEPELLPAAPTIALLSFASTTTISSLLATNTQGVAVAAQTAGAAYYCAQNTF